MTTNYTKNFALALPDFRYGPWHDLVNADFDKIDSLIYGALSNANVGVWQNNTAYIVGISVLDSAAGTTWMCSVANTSAVSGTFAAERAAHPTYWVQLLAGFAPRGQWTNSTNYFPYDLVYDSARGIMALCKTTHTSNPSGNIKDDATFWSFLIDMSSSTLATAVAVTYSNSSSAIPSTNVQGAIDYIETQVVSLNNVNVTQGSQISSLQSSDSTQNTSLTSHGTRLTAVENTNTTQDSTLATHTSQIATINATLASGVFFPAGTVLCFFQAAAPTGWTKVTTHSDKLLRVVSGSGGGSGGSTAFSTFNAQTVIGTTTLSTTTMPSHNHTIGAALPQFSSVVAGGATLGGAGTDTNYTGGSGGHNHTVTTSIAYVDIILCSKN
jgi:hypothetical protein